MLLRAQEAVVFGRKGLDDDVPGPIAAPSAARHLRKNLKRALRGAEVGQIQGKIRLQHADQRDGGEVMAFGDHLRANQDVDVAPPHVAQHPRAHAHGVCRVAIESGEAGIGKMFGDRAFDLFGAGANRLEMIALAIRADTWAREGVFAIVTS